MTAEGLRQSFADDSGHERLVLDTSVDVPGRRGGPRVQIDGLRKVGDLAKGGRKGSEMDRPRGTRDGQTPAHGVTVDPDRTGGLASRCRSPDADVLPSSPRAFLHHAKSCAERSHSRTLSL
jgi:hypothetical protein